MAAFSRVNTNPNKNILSDQVIPPTPTIPHLDLSVLEATVITEACLSCVKLCGYAARSIHPVPCNVVHLLHHSTCLGKQRPFRRGQSTSPRLLGPHILCRAHGVWRRKKEKHCTAREGQVWGSGGEYQRRLVGTVADYRHCCVFLLEDGEVGVSAPRVRWCA